MCRELWDCQGANIASLKKEMYGEKLIPGPKKGFWREITCHFFAVVLLQMDLGNVDMWKM